jgi:hypothetical protein
MSTSAAPRTALPRRTYTTAQAAHVILGGTDTEAYWGFTFSEFVERLQASMLKHIGNPADAPWRKHIDYTSEDYIQLQQLLDGLDFAKDPADKLDQSLASTFMHRCDLVGMHGGANSIGVGKDTVANALKPHGFVSMSFADPLKASLSMAYGVPVRYFYDRDLKEVPLPGSGPQFTPRRLMQPWGTEVVRGIEPKIWLLRHQLRVASAMLDLANIARQHPERISSLNGIRVAVPDVRFADESEYLHSVGGFNAWISRPSLANASLSNGHISEAGIPKHPTDLHLVNEGSLQEFQDHASRMVLARFSSSPAAAARRIAKP